MGKLILVRHGESKWNKKQIFTGWVDITLTRKGIDEIQVLAKKLRKIKFDLMFASCLERAQATLLLIASEQEKTAIFMHEEKKYNANADSNHSIPIFTDCDLNERYYGSLQGMKKELARERFGEKQVCKWRRSYKSRPPEGESLQDVCCRVKAFFEENIKPVLDNDKNVLISAHGNSLRALIKYIDNISDDEIAHLELAPGDMISYTIENKKLIKDDGGHKFTRPLEWK
ncbi:MAG: 2,3-bisphosphoglycerate-dependent phosphoglycerate mutase [Candidatus Moranbacteria bacterium]|nr:2,3-bisphosphoglycerate-dependent phosphoglycerate mutase [Candidatus Moranbacteria bacterium]